MNKNFLLARVEVIEKSPELTAKFRDVYGTDFTMIKATIREDMIKPKAVKLIEELTANIEIKEVNVYSTDGVYVSSVEYKISTDLKRTILKVLKDIRKNPLIQECQIDGSEIWGDIKLFNSTIDDVEKQETHGFRSDVQRIIIKKSGNIVFKAYSKWSDDFLTFEIE